MFDTPVALILLTAKEFRLRQNPRRPASWGVFLDQGAFGAGAAGVCRLRRCLF